MSEKKYLDSDTAYDEGTLYDWYISSVDDSDPIWTDAHIYELVNDFYMIPKDTPVVDVAPVVHAHWIREYHENDVYSIHFVCSNCRTCMETTRYERECSLKFCPECGAKMDESEDTDNA